MTELMIKMTSWLVAAMLLGFMVAWFLSRIIYNRQQHRIEDMFDAIILERNNMIDELEKDFRKERKVFETVSNELKDAEKALAERTSLLKKLQARVNTDSIDNTLQELQKQNTLLSTENQKLEELDKKRLIELKSFEEVLLLAEDKIEESEKSYFKVLEKLNEEMEKLTLENTKHRESIKLYEKRMKMLRKELKLYKAESIDAEFIISKDQFIAVEDQLKKYQKEINILQNSNTELLLKLKKSDRKLKIQRHL